MAVTVREAGPADRVLVGRLLELYLHDFSELDGRDVDPDGSYPYPWLDLYWSDAERVAYVFDVGGRPAGFALVRLGATAEMAEFFVLRKYRRQGVGAAAARDVIARHRGRWVVRQAAENADATSFWRRVVPVPFEERCHPDGGVEQAFDTSA